MKQFNLQIFNHLLLACVLFFSPLYLALNLEILFRGILEIIIHNEMDRTISL